MARRSFEEKRTGAGPGIGDWVSSRLDCRDGRHAAALEARAGARNGTGGTLRSVRLDFLCGLGDCVATHLHAGPRGIAESRMKNLVDRQHLMSGARRTQGATSRE